MIYFVIGFILGVFLMSVLCIEKEQSYKKGYETAKKYFSEKYQ